MTSDMIAPGPEAAGSLGHSEGTETLSSKTKRGSVWTLVGYGSSQILRLVNNLILWRLLYAEAFGLMALVNVFMVGLAMFSDIGIGPSIVQHDRGEEPKYLNTAWTIQIVRGICLFLAACILATPMAYFYQQHQLVHLVPVAALGSMISGFNSTCLFTETRRIRLGRLTAIDLTTQVLGLVTTIVFAWLLRSVWALVIGGLVAGALRLILSHTFLPGVRNRLCWDRGHVRSLLHFGRWIFISTLLTFVVMQSDRLIFGKMIPMALLGVYSIAVTWASMPVSVFERVFSAVLFPLLSGLRHKGIDFSSAYLEARKPWTLLGGWIAACLISGGPTLIRLLYDARATSAGWIIQVLAAGMWLLLLENANGTALLALGHPKWVAAGNAAKLVGMFVLIPIGYAWLGFPGAVVGFAGSESFRYITSVIGARKHHVACFGQDCRLSLLVVATAAAGHLAARWLAPFVQALALRPTKLGVFLEGLGIAICAGIGWGIVYLLDRSRRTNVSPVPVAASLSDKVIP